MKNYTTSTIISIGLFIVVSLTWGTTWLAMSEALVSFPPVVATAFRFLLAAPFLIIATKASGAPLLFPRGTRRLQFILMIFYFTLPFTLMIYGEETVSSGMASLLFSVMPVAVVIFSWFILKESITPIQMAGTFTVMLSLGVIIFNESGTPEIGSFRGVIAILLAVTLHAVVYIQCRKHCASISVLTYNALPVLGAGVLLFITGLTSGQFPVKHVDIHSVYAVSYLGIVAGVFGIMAYFELQKRVLPFYASLVYFIFPLIAISLENLTTHHMISFASTMMVIPFISGICLVLHPKWKASNIAESRK